MSFLHKFSFNTPPSEVNELDRGLSASSIRKGIKPKRMNIHFISLYELANIPKEPPSFEVGTHYMNCRIFDNVFNIKSEDYLSASIFLSSTEVFFQVKKEKIQKLKIKEPVKVTHWDYYEDVFTNTKERIKELKLKGPVVKSTFTDDWP
jgi:hypothetical protein